MPVGITYVLTYVRKKSEIVEIVFLIFFLDTQRFPRD